MVQYKQYACAWKHDRIVIYMVMMDIAISIVTTAVATSNHYHTNNAGSAPTSSDVKETKPKNYCYCYICYYLFFSLLLEVKLYGIYLFICLGRQVHEFFFRQAASPPNETKI